VNKIEGYSNLTYCKIIQHIWEVYLGILVLRLRKKASIVEIYTGGNTYEITDCFQEHVSIPSENKLSHSTPYIHDPNILTEHLKR
jgi:hypothetical protein